MKYLGFTCTKILAGLKCRSHSTLVKSVQVTAPLINITIKTTQIPLDIQYYSILLKDWGQETLLMLFMNSSSSW